MRVPEPGSLKIDRQDLIRAIEQRLEQYADAAPTSGDQTDPAWLLIEEAAWLVEALSERLDQYPEALLQQVVHAMGGALLPALPAVGVVVAGPKTHGVLLGPRKRCFTTFYTPQTEVRQAVPFVLADRAVSLVAGTLTRWYRTSGRSLVRQEQRPEGLHVTRGPYVRSSAFDGQQITYTLTASPTSTLLGELNKAIVATERRGVGWIKMEATWKAGTIKLTAVIDPNAAIREPTEPGEPVTVAYRSLDSETWRPPLTLADDMPDGMALHLCDASTYEVVGLADQPVRLTWEAEPMPSSLPKALWDTLYARNDALPSQMPDAVVSLGDEAPRWLSAAVGEGRWAGLTERPCSLVEVSLDEPVGPEGVTVRLAIGVEDVFTAEALAPEVGFHLLREDRAPVPIEEFVRCWQLVVPATHQRQDNDTVVAYDVSLPEGATGLLLQVFGEDSDPPAVLLNACLVVNAPRVADGRLIPLRDYRPLRVDLDWDDVVTDDVLRRLVEGPLAQSVVPSLDPTRFGVTELAPDRHREQSQNHWAGFDVDPTDGHFVLWQPRLRESEVQLRIGEDLYLGWYRRTNGREGLVGIDQITLVEQTVEESLVVSSVSNPYPTVGGRDAEDPSLAIERLFGPATTAPLLPIDFEHDLRRHLGALGVGWMTRVWTHAERRLFECWCWQDLPLVGYAPGSAAASSPMARQGVSGLVEPGKIREAMTAVPEDLVISVGPMQGPVDGARFSEVAREAENWFRNRVRRRYQHFRRLHVVPALPLTLYSHRDLLEEQVIPKFGLWEFDERDFVSDPYGVWRRVEPDVSLVDAAITVILWPQDWPRVVPEGVR